MAKLVVICSCWWLLMVIVGGYWLMIDVCWWLLVVVEGCWWWLTWQLMVILTAVTEAVLVFWHIPVLTDGSHGWCSGRFGTLRFSAISTIYLHLLYIYCTSSPAPNLILKKKLQINCRFLDPQPISAPLVPSRLRWEICVSLTESGFNQAR